MSLPGPYTQKRKPWKKQLGTRHRSNANETVSDENLRKFWTSSHDALVLRQTIEMNTTKVSKYERLLRTWLPEKVRTQKIPGPKVG